MNAELDEYKDAYDKNYVLDNRLTMNWYPERVARLARTGSMLELGLGHGYSTAYFARAFDRYVVLEGSGEMIERFRSRFPNLEPEIVQGFFEDFSTDDRFDAIGMGFVLEHVDDPAQLLRRYAEFLAPAGSIFIAVPNAEAMHRRLGYAAGLLPELTTLSPVDRSFGHQRYFTKATLIEMVTSAGLRVEAAEGILLKPVTTQQLEQLNLSEPILQAMLQVGIDFPELCNSILLQVGRA